MDTFLTTSSICKFHVSLLSNDKPRRLTDFTTLTLLLLISIGLKSRGTFEKEIRSSLHFSSFSFISLFWDHCDILLAIVCALLCWFLSTVSDAVVSSTYFHRSVPVVDRSFIMIKKSHGPNMVPEGRPKVLHPNLKNILVKV